MLIGATSDVERALFVGVGLLIIAAAFGAFMLAGRRLVRRLTRPSPVPSIRRRRDERLSLLVLSSNLLATSANHLGFKTCCA